MSNKKLAVLISIFILLSAALSLVLAYEEEIEEKAKQIFEKYFQDKIDSSLSPEEQEEFDSFKAKEGSDKFVNLIVNKKVTSDAGASDE